MIMIFEMFYLHFSVESQMMDDMAYIMSRKCSFDV